MERCRWGSCLSLGRGGGAAGDPSAGWQKCGPSFPPSGGHSWSLLSLFLPKKRFTTLPFWVGVSGPSLTCGCWSHQHSEGQSQGQVEGWKRDSGDPSKASRRRAGQWNLRGVGVRSLELGRQSLRVERTGAGWGSRASSRLLNAGRGRRRPALQFPGRGLSWRPPTPSRLKGPVQVLLPVEGEDPYSSARPRLQLKDSERIPEEPGFPGLRLKGSPRRTPLEGDVSWAGPRFCPLLLQGSGGGGRPHARPGRKDRQTLSTARTALGLLCL